MNRKQLLDLLRKHGYAADPTLKGVKSWLAENADEIEINVTDANGKSVSIEDIWKNKTVTISVSADAGEQVEVVDASQPETEAMDEEEEDDPNAEKMARLESENQRLRSMTKTGSRATRIDAKSQTRTFATKHDIAKKSYDLRAKSGRAVYPDADTAEVAGAWIRLKIAGCAPERFSNYEQKASDERIVTKSLGENSNLYGGALVPDEFEANLIELFEEYGAARRALSWRTMTRDTLLIPKETAEVTIALIGENAAITAQNKPTYGNVELVAKKVGGLIQVSNELMNDAAVNVADNISRSFARGFAGFEDDCLWNGDGSPTYAGVTGFKNTITGGTSASSPSSLTAGSPSAFTNDHILAAIGLLPEYADGPGVAWMCHKSMYAQVLERVVQDAGGITLGDGRGKIVPTIYGYPVIFNQKMPATDPSGGVILFGNFDLAAKAGTVGGSYEIAASDQRYFEYDQTAVRGLERFAMAVHEGSSTSVVSPVVQLYTT